MLTYSEYRKIAHNLIKAVNEQGGVTAHPSPEGALYEPHKAGYMVSLPPDPRTNVVLADDCPVLVQEDLLIPFLTVAMELVFERGPAGGDLWIGGWLERDSAGVPQARHFDVSEQVMDRERALLAGHIRNQVSIYDLAAGECLDTGGTGRAGLL
jgi:hypothetical protein